MASILDKIDQLSSELQALLPMSEENQRRLDKKFRLEFNYNSNHLEGNTLTYGETELLLIFDDTKGNHNFREYEEMKAHDVAFNLVKEWAGEPERPLTEQSIKNLNEIILVRPFWKDAITADGQPTRRQIKIGNYKEYPNSVRLANGEIFHYATPSETPLKMQELMDWYREEENALHPVTLAAMLHYKFVSIHPFDDGNGRISRLLMNYVFLKNNLPPIIIKSADKQNYLNVLHLADLGDYEPFITYIGEQLAWSLEVSIKAAKGEDISEETDFYKEIELLQKKMQQKKMQPKFSEAMVWDILEFAFFPLSEKIASQFFKGNTFFSTQMQSNLISKTQESKGSLHLNKVERNSRNEQVLDFVKNAKSMWFLYETSGPKNEGLKIFKWGYSFRILFNAENYQLITPSIEKSYNYGEFPTEADQKEFLQEAQQSFLKMLKENIQ